MINNQQNAPNRGVFVYICTVYCYNSNMTNSDEVRNNTNTSKNDTIVLQREFDMYCIWKSLPPMIISPNKGTVDEVLEQLRIDDPILIELAKLRTQGDFAKHFNVSPDTLLTGTN